MAVAACFGSPLLMNIMGIGVSLTLYTALNGHSIASPVSKQCRVAYLFLAIALVSQCIAFPMGGYRVSRAFALYLICIYPVFLTVSCLVATGVIPESALCWSWGPPCS